MRSIGLAFILVLGVACPVSAQRISVFKDTGVQAGGNASWQAHRGERRSDRGRVVDKKVTLPKFDTDAAVTARISLTPVRGEMACAGSLQLVAADGQTVEMIRFATGFGGRTQHQQDVTSLKPLLAKGPVTVRVFIDTHVPQAWTVDVDLVVQPKRGRPAAWTQAVVPPTTWEARHFERGRQRFTVTVPPGVGKVEMRYFATGHCTNVKDQAGDEFTTRTHRIYVDGKPVYTAKPWRTDGARFRAANPKAGRWNDKGKEVRASDLPRSGWVAGDVVKPMAIDLTKHLTPGTHVIEYHVDGIKPATGGGKGYWRVSSYLWATPAR